jgi:rhomboid protease GluP
MINIEQTLPTNTTSSQLWAVRFLPAPRTQGRWRLGGKGSIAIGPDSIELQGQRQRSFWLPTKQRIELLPAQIRNVSVHGRRVDFEAVVGGSKPEAVRIVTANAQAASAVGALLPTTCTEHFTRTQVEQREFANALRQLGARPVVTLALVAINVLVYIAASSHGTGWVTAQPALLIHWGTNYAPATLAGDWWRLFTSMFVHFGLMHIALNMWALLALGPRVERLFGSACYLLLYVFAGLCGSVASIWWNPAVNSAGASGAIFGVIGGLLAFTLNPATRLPASITGNQRASALFFIFYNLVNGFGHQGIDNACHIGGLLGGLAMGWFLAQPLDSEARQSQPVRLAAATALGALTLFALIWPLSRRPHLTLAEVAFRLDIYWLGEQEASAQSRALELDHSMQQHEITSAKYGEQIADTLVPTWIAMEKRLDNDALPPNSSLAPLRQALLTYVDDRRQGLELFSKASIRNDPSTLRQAKEMLSRSDAAAKSVSRLIAAMK